MARPTADEELQLRKRARRRLIGAIVLVMVAVLVLPMVLDSEPKPASQDIEIRIPSPDAGAFKSKIVPIVPAPGTGPDARPSGGATTPAAGVRKSAPEEPRAPAAAAAKEKDAGKPPIAAETPRPAVRTEAPKPEAAVAEHAGGTHVVQITALRNAERATEIQERVRAAGIKSYIEVVKTTKGDVTRVRAGPFQTSEAAEAAREQIQRIDFDGKKLDGKVIPVK